MTPEWSHRVPLDRIGAGETTHVLAAGEDERAALARRFGWTAVDALSAEVGLARKAAGIEARGRFAARIAQPCVVTGEPVSATIEQPIHLIFQAPDLPTGNEDEVELSAGDLDTVEHDGSAVDLGEAVAQSLALAAPAFPRSPAAAARLAEAGVVSEGEEGGALAAQLKGLLRRD